MILTEEIQADRNSEHQVAPRAHEWDDCGCCLYCGFDGAEWYWWKHSTYEGRAQPNACQPKCRWTHTTGPATLGPDIK